MSVIRFRCHRCGAKQKADSSEAYEHAECRKCGTEYYIPEGNDAASIPLMHEGGAAVLPGASAKKVVRKRKVVRTTKKSKEEAAPTPPPPPPAPIPPTVPEPPRAPPPPAEPAVRAQREPEPEPEPAPEPEPVEAVPETEPDIPDARPPAETGLYEDAFEDPELIEDGHEAEVAPAPGPSSPGPEPQHSPAPEPGPESERPPEPAPSEPASGLRMPPSTKPKVGLAMPPSAGTSKSPVGLAAAPKPKRGRRDPRARKLDPRIKLSGSPRISMSGLPRNTLGRLGFDPDPGSEGFRYHGKRGEHFGNWILDVLLSFATLGVYAPVAVCNLRKHFLRNTSFLGQRFDYAGNPYWLLLPIPLYVVASLLFSGLYFAVAFIGGLVAPDSILMVITVLCVGVTLSIALNFAILLAREWCKSHMIHDTVWNGVRFKFGQPIRSLGPMAVSILVGSLAMLVLTAILVGTSALLAESRGVGAAIGRFVLMCGYNLAILWIVLSIRATGIRRRVYQTSFLGKTFKMNPLQDTTALASSAGRVMGTTLLFMMGSGFVMLLGAAVNAGAVAVVLAIVGLVLLAWMVLFLPFNLIGIVLLHEHRYVVSELRLHNLRFVTDITYRHVLVGRVLPYAAAWWAAIITGFLALVSGVAATQALEGMHSYDMARYVFATTGVAMYLLAPVVFLLVLAVVHYPCATYWHRKVCGNVRTAGPIPMHVFLPEFLKARPDLMEKLAEEDEEE